MLLTEEFYKSKEIKNFNLDSNFSQKLDNIYYVNHLS